MNLTGLDLKRKIGPLPAGAWLGIIALGLGAAWVMRQRSSGGGGADSLTPVDSGVSLAPVGDPLSGFTATGIDAVTPMSPAAGTPTSNQEWLSLAAKNLAALRRPYAHNEIIVALTRFTSGDTQTARDTTIINDAISVTGYPPEPVPVPLAAAPTKAPVDPKTPGQPGYEATPPALVSKASLGKRRTRVLARGVRGERADEIARRVYGSSRYANYIRAYNKTLLERNGKFIGYTAPLPTGVAVAY